MMFGGVQSTEWLVTVYKGINLVGQPPQCYCLQSPGTFRASDQGHSLQRRRARAGPRHRLIHRLCQRSRTAGKAGAAIVRCRDAVLARSQRRSCELCHASTQGRSLQDRRAVGARVPFDDSAVLEMPETRNEERSRDAGQTPLKFVEVAAAEH
jgi:hypothetical protein